MRIIAGKHRTRKIEYPLGQEIRPTADVVRQALFTKLQFFIEGKTVLDLYAGSGALGIEALSRGGKEVIFVDNNRGCIQTIKKNLETIKENAQVIFSDALSALDRFSSEFDLILIDPPYADGLYEKTLIKIAENKLLSNNGIIVCEHEKTAKINFEPFEIFDQKRYGKKMLTYLRNKT